MVGEFCLSLALGFGHNRIGSRPSLLPRDCLHCGVCCTSDSPTYVRLTGQDWGCLGSDAERLAHFIGNRAYLRMRGGRCAALELRTGTGGTEHFCTIYNRRPQACRDLARGSPACEAEWLRKGGSSRLPDCQRNAVD